MDNSISGSRFCCAFAVLSFFLHFLLDYRAQCVKILSKKSVSCVLFNCIQRLREQWRSFPGPGWRERCAGYVGFYSCLHGEQEFFYKSCRQSDGCNAADRTAVMAEHKAEERNSYDNLYFIDSRERIG